MNFILNMGFQSLKTAEFLNRKVYYKKCIRAKLSIYKYIRDLLVGIFFYLISNKHCVAFLENGIFQWIFLPSSQIR